MLKLLLELAVSEIFIGLGTQLTDFTIAGYWSRSEIFRRQNLKYHIVAN